MKREKIIINFKRELLYPRFGTLKQQKIKIKANLKKANTNWKPWGFAFIYGELNY